MVGRYLLYGTSAYPVEPAVAGMEGQRLLGRRRIETHSDKRGAATLQPLFLRTAVYPGRSFADGRRQAGNYVVERVRRLVRQRVPLGICLNSLHCGGGGDFSVVSAAHPVRHAEDAKLGEYPVSVLVVLALAPKISLYGELEMAEVCHCSLRTPQTPLEDSASSEDSSWSLAVCPNQ